MTTIIKFSSRATMIIVCLGIVAIVMTIVKATDSTTAVKAIGTVPIGTILPFHQYEGIVSIPSDGWQICDGEPIKDPKSPLFGKNTPDLRNRFLKGSDDPHVIGPGGKIYKHDTISLDHKHKTPILYHNKLKGTSPVKVYKQSPFGSATADEGTVEIWKFHTLKDNEGWAVQLANDKWLLTDKPYVEPNNNTSDLSDEYKIKIPAYYSIVYIIRIK